MAAYKLVLIRHGESCWNQENRFCGWYDADLSETGVHEAQRGGQALKGKILCWVVRLETDAGGNVKTGRQQTATQPGLQERT